jgi:hypothetical protein
LDKEEWVEQGNKKPSFSLNEFRSWLSEQKDLTDFFDISNRVGADRPGDDMVGCEVYTKVSNKKLLERIQSEGADPELLIEDLVENGGMILAVDGKDLLIEVETGSFYLPRFCVKIKKQA